MCRFMSAIVMRNGDIICDPRIDSHEELIEKFNIHDGPCQLDRFCRIEFIPPPDDWSKLFDTSAWKLRVDDKFTPEWFSHEKIRLQLISKVQTLLIQEERNKLEGGCWILGSGAKIKEAKDVLIRWMVKDASIENLTGHSSIDSMLDSSSIKEMRDFSEVGVMYNHTKIGIMHDQSEVGWMCHCSRVMEKRDNSKIKLIWSSAKVIRTYDNKGKRVY